MYKNFIETKNLMLLPFKSSYAVGAFNNIFKHEQTARFMLWQPDATVADTKARILRWAEAYKNEFCYFIFSKQNLNSPIGFVLAVKQNETTFGDIGLCLGRNFAGNGYGQEVLKVLIDYLKSLGVKTISYSCFVENVASNKLATKFGFKLTQVKDRFVKKYDKFMPENWYVLNL